MLIAYIFMLLILASFFHYLLEKMGTSIGSWKESLCCWWFEYCSCFYRQVWRATWLWEANVSLLLAFFFCYGSNYKASGNNNAFLSHFPNERFREWLRSMLREHGGPFFDAFRSKHPERYWNAPELPNCLCTWFCFYKLLIFTWKQPHWSNRTLFVSCNNELSLLYFHYPWLT